MVIVLALLYFYFLFCSNKSCEVEGLIETRRFFARPSAIVMMILARIARSTGFVRMDGLIVQEIQQSMY